VACGVTPENSTLRFGWNSILEAAEAGANSTRSMVATRGRAARLGERSLGHMDPGAASAVIILRAMKETFDEGEREGAGRR
jgi:dihydroxyacetone kinase-like protein